VATLTKSKRNEVARINIVQAQVEEMYFMFYLEYRNVALSRGISHGLPTKSKCSHSLKTQVRWVKHNGLIVVGENPPTGVDRQHESREAQRLYLSALQLTRALRLRFVGRATWPIPGQEGVWCASASFLYEQSHVNISPSRSRLSRWLLHWLWRADYNPA
jgi:hypothetical protein